MVIKEDLSAKIEMKPIGYEWAVGSILICLEVNIKTWEGDLKDTIFVTLNDIEEGYEEIDYEIYKNDSTNLADLKLLVWYDYHVDKSEGLYKYLALKYENTGKFLESIKKDLCKYAREELNIKPYVFESTMNFILDEIRIFMFAKEDYKTSYKNIITNTEEEWIEIYGTKISYKGLSDRQTCNLINGILRNKELDAVIEMAEPIQGYTKDEILESVRRSWDEA